jgi:hypothetical protein
MPGGIRYSRRSGLRELVNASHEIIDADFTEAAE